MSGSDVRRAHAPRDAGDDGPGAATPRLYFAHGEHDGMSADRPLRVLHVSTTDVGGGAEAVALGLHRACLEQGWESRLVVGRRRGQTPGVVELDELAPTVVGRLQGRARRWAASHDVGRPPLARAIRGLSDPRRAVEALLGIEHLDFPATWRLLDAMPGAAPDVVHLHNLHGNYFDLRALPSLSRQVSTLVTLHDEWLMTGHCAYSVGCERWRSGCGECPDLRLPPEVHRDATRYNWGRKRGALAGARLHVVTPSRWLLERARSSLLADSLVDGHVIPNGIDLDVFRPAPRDEARRELGLSADDRVILFVGVNARGYGFKDLPTLLAAVAPLSTSRPTLRVKVIGAEGASERAGAALVEYARERDPRRLARWYQACDVFVHSTRAESTTPRVVLEAMACGRPVIATDAAATGELLDDGRDALLVPPRDPGALARRIAEVLDAPGLATALGAAAAETARRFDVRARHAEYFARYRALAR